MHGLYFKSPIHEFLSKRDMDNPFPLVDSRALALLWAPSMEVVQSENWTSPIPQQDPRMTAVLRHLILLNYDSKCSSPPSEGLYQAALASLDNSSMAADVGQLDRMIAFRLTDWRSKLMDTLRDFSRVQGSLGRLPAVGDHCVEQLRTIGSQTNSLSVIHNLLSAGVSLKLYCVSERY